MIETVDLFDPGPAARLLAEAWRSGIILSELPAEVRPRTMLQGYAIQDRLIAALGQTPIGWKLGMGSHVQKRTAGVGRSIAGRVLEAFVYRDGDTITLPNDAPVTVEFEIAYVLGRNVVPDEATFPVIDAVKNIQVTFELVLSRFKDRRAVGWPSFAADNGAFQALVLGPTIAPTDIPELVRTLVVSANGDEAARSLSSDDVTDPQGALEDLISIARERGETLPAGSIVSTGTVSKPFTLSGSAEIRANFLGQTLGFRTTPGHGNAT